MTMPSFNIFILNSPEREQKKVVAKGKAKQGKNKLKKALDKENELGLNLDILKELKKISSSTPITSHTGGG